MKTIFNRLPVLAIAAIGLALALSVTPLAQVMYDGAHTGGAAWATATASLGDLGQVITSATN